MLCFASANVRNSGKSHGHTPLLSCMPRMCGTPIIPKIMKQRLASLETHRVCPEKFLNQKERLFAFVDSGCLSFSLINFCRPGESFRQDRIFLWQNFTGGTAMIGTITKQSRARKQTPGTSAQDSHSPVLGEELLSDKSESRLQSEC